MLVKTSLGIRNPTPTLPVNGEGEILLPLVNQGNAAGSITPPQPSRLTRREKSYFPSLAREIQRV
ncbi:hypothetical protein H6F50_19730 [Coleofasciculus sp. FACHB-712]|uniref:hypothetical protein n=1 Tax=Coleofasciculus sp. FACHB-712 TaxID=2692789 RepID=UPI0016898096|nr:hypothetical protein [Coleofasciculus sp. FACHB-712]MBD1944561.1 hypothetical protein [Coleofasciculus sp. FACHB-712]